MRIWCQSASAFGIDDAWDPYEKALKANIQKVVRPDTKVDIYGTDYTIPGIGRYFTSRMIAQMQAIRNAMRAQEQGYDAFVQISTHDAGIDEIREALDIPVVFSGETALHLVNLLSEKFAFITHNNELYRKCLELAERNGMTHRMVPGEHLNLGEYGGVMGLYKDPQKHIEWITKVAKEIVARGAGLLFPSANSLGSWMIANNIREVDGAIVLDVTGAVIKMTELMVDLKAAGIYRSPKYYSSPPSEVMQELKKIYGV